MSTNYLSTILSSINNAGTAIDENIKSKEERARQARLDAMTSETHAQNITKGQQDIQKTADEKAKVDAYNAQIEEILKGEQAGPQQAVETARPQIEQAGATAATGKLNQQYNQGETLSMEQKRDLVNQANAKYPSLGRLPGQAVERNLGGLKTGNGNLNVLGDVEKYGYAAPEKPVSTPESIAAGAEASTAAKNKVLSEYKPDYVSQFANATNKLGKYGDLGKTFLGNKKDLADKQVQSETSKALNAATNAQREADRQQSAEDKQAQRDLMRELAANKNGDKNVVLSQKQEQFIQNKLTKLGDEIDPSKNVRNAFAISKIGFDRAERLQSLAESFKNGNLIRDAEIEELAIGLNQMLSGASQGSQKQVEALVPKTAMGSAMKLKQWLFNEPTGMNQKKFVDRMNMSIVREKNTMADQIKRTQFQKIAKYNFVRKADPDGWEETLMSYGVDPSEYDAWTKNGYKQTSAVQVPEEVKPSVGGTPGDKFIVGKVYTDAQGNKATYAGNGKWQ